MKLATQLMTLVRPLSFLLVIFLCAPAMAQHRKGHHGTKTKRHHKHSQKKVYKKKVYQKKVVTKKHHRHSHHRPRTHIYFGTHPRYSYGHRYHSHHSHYHHVHTSHCPSSHHVDVRIVYKDTFSPPALSCPVRTEEVGDGLTQWCETKRGTKHGPYRQWRSDGTLVAAGEYAYDTKDNVWLHYHPNGTVQRETEYDEGERVGTTYTWDEDGAVISVVTH